MRKKKYTRKIWKRFLHLCFISSFFLFLMCFQTLKNSLFLSVLLRIENDSCKDKRNKHFILLIYTYIVNLSGDFLSFSFLFFLFWKFSIISHHICIFFLFFFCLMYNYWTLLNTNADHWLIVCRIIVIRIAIMISWISTDANFW